MLETRWLTTVLAPQATMPPTEFLKPESSIWCFDRVWLTYPVYCQTSFLSPMIRHIDDASVVWIIISDVFVFPGTPIQFIQLLDVENKTLCQFLASSISQGGTEMWILFLNASDLCNVKVFNFTPYFQLTVSYMTRVWIWFRKFYTCFLCRFRRTIMLWDIPVSILVKYSNNINL